LNVYGDWRIDGLRITGLQNKLFKPKHMQKLEDAKAEMMK
jgi:hypothetical protein